MQTRDTSSGDGPARQCGCGEDAIILTVQKENENKGRKFWKCQRKEAPCDYFEWDDKPPKSGAFGSDGSGMPSRTASLDTNNAGVADVCYKVSPLLGDTTFNILTVVFSVIKRATGPVVGTLLSQKPVLLSDHCNPSACPNGDGPDTKRTKGFGSSSNDRNSAGSTDVCYKVSLFSA